MWRGQASASASAGATITAVPGPPALPATPVPPAPVSLVLPSTVPVTTPSSPAGAIPGVKVIALDNKRR